MPSFERNGLESMKYADLVKLAKEHGAYRRYAPKAELVEKLLVVREAPVESLCINVSVGHVAVGINSSRSTPQSASRSLAGPVNNRRRLNRKQTTDLQVSQKPLSRRMTRQRTFEVEDSGGNEGVCQEETSTLTHSLGIKREGTFEVQDRNTNDKFDESELHVITPNLRREGTYEIESPGLMKTRRSSPQVNLKRDRTFELESATSTKNASVITTAENKSLKPTLEVMRASRLKAPGRTSLRSPLLLRNSIASPSCVKQIKNSRNVKCVSESVSPRARTKSKIPSLMAEIQRKKDQVSAKKFADATGEKQSIVKKAPDFKSIHKRLFGKMESLVDSKLKVIDRATSMQKYQDSKKSPPNRKVVRKLLSPKIGNSKLAPPKPVLKQAPSAFASNLMPIQKRPSIGSVIPGISRLQSPKVELQFNSKASGIPMKVKVTKATEPARREVFKAAVMGRNPIRRKSPMSKARQCLQSVRLNKRFELQMKHRMAQQGM